jgi:hypothetical protein
MATKFTVEHVFDTDVDSFWKEIFFNDEYNRRLYEEALGFGYQKLELNDLGGGVWTRRVPTDPKADNVPAAMRKIVGDTLYYIEDGRFDPASKRWKFSVTTSKAADKVEIHGEYWVEPRGDARVVRYCTTQIHVKVPLVGAVIEKFVEKQTRENYDKAAAFTNRWIAGTRG